MNFETRLKSFELASTIYGNVGINELIDKAHIIEQYLNGNKNKIISPKTEEKTNYLYDISTFCSIIKTPSVDINDGSVYNYSIEIMEKMFHGKNIIVDLPRNSGKTIMSIIYSLYISLKTPNNKVLFVVRKGPNVGEITNIFSKIINDFPTEIYSMISDIKKNSIKFTNNSEIIVKAASNHMSSETDYTHIIVDESPFISNSYIRDMLWMTSSGPQFIMTGSFKLANNSFYDELFKSWSVFNTENIKHWFYMVRKDIYSGELLYISEVPKIPEITRVLDAEVKEISSEYFTNDVNKAHEFNEKSKSFNNLYESIINYHINDHVVKLFDNKTDVPPFLDDIIISPYKGILPYDFYGRISKVISFQIKYLLKIDEIKKFLPCYKYFSYHLPDGYNHRTVYSDDMIQIRGSNDIESVHSDYVISSSVLAHYV